MRSEMEDFCRRAKVVLEKSSVENPQSNGASDIGVKQVKGIFAKARMEGRSKEEGLFMLQTTPRAPGMLSPMRLFYGREPRIPELPGLVDLRDEAASACAKNQNKLDRKTRANTKTERLDTSPLDLEIGLQVVMRNPKTNLWDIKGTIVSIRQGVGAVMSKQTPPTEHI